jgi:hypothetical protein
MRGKKLTRCSLHAEGDGSMMTSVGFVGLEDMGLPMAQHWRKVGYALHVFTRTAVDDARSRETDAKQGEGSQHEMLAAPSGIKGGIR